jgi:Spy/CpxP family protein refolding chaperone
MKKYLFAVILAVLLVSVYAAAQPPATTPPPKPPAAAAPGAAPAPGGPPPGVTPQQRDRWDQELTELRNRLDQANVSEDRQLLAIYVLGAEVGPFDTGHVLAAKQELKLTDDQVTKLKDLAKDEMAKTRDILNDEQKGMVEQLPTVLVLDVARQAAPLIMMPRPGAGGPGAPPGAPPAGAPRPPTTPPPATAPPAATTPPSPSK